MPPRFHSERKSVNTQSSIIKGSSVNRFCPILLTRYKKILMPTSFLKMHLESLAHFDTAFFQPFVSTDAQHNNFATNPMPLSLFITRQAVIPNSTQDTINQPIDTQLARYQLVRPLNSPPLLILYLMYFSSYFMSSTYYIRIITPLRFSIISCYQFALINTTFLLPLIIISTHQASSYGQRR